MICAQTGKECPSLAFVEAHEEEAASQQVDTAQAQHLCSEGLMLRDIAGKVPNLDCGLAALAVERLVFAEEVQDA